MRLTTYKGLQTTLRRLLIDLDTLAGGRMPEGNLSGLSGWQEIAVIASKHAHELGDQLQRAGEGNHESFLSFPSPADFYDTTCEVVE